MAERSFCETIPVAAIVRSPVRNAAEKQAQAQGPFRPFWITFFNGMLVDQFTIGYFLYLVGVFCDRKNR